MNQIYQIVQPPVNALPIVSVYIPSISCDYDTYTIGFIFQQLFGIVYRIDSVYNTSANPNFKSIFVYYYQYSAFEAIESNKIFPGQYVPCKQLYRRTPINPAEYWLIFPNKTMFPDTTQTLEQIGEKMYYLESILIAEVNDEELEILRLNRTYLNELHYVQNNREYFYFPVSYYLNTTINVHQLAQNVKLMEERMEERLADEAEMEERMAEMEERMAEMMDDDKIMDEMMRDDEELKIKKIREDEEELKITKMREYDEAFRRERDEEDERDRAEEEANYRDDRADRYDEYRDDRDDDYYRDDSDMIDNDDRNDYINDEYY